MRCAIILESGYLILLVKIWICVRATLLYLRAARVHYLLPWYHLMSRRLFRDLLRIKSGSIGSYRRDVTTITEEKILIFWDRGALIFYWLLRMWKNEMLWNYGRSAIDIALSSTLSRGWGHHCRLSPRSLLSLTVRGKGTNRHLIIKVSCVLRLRPFVMMWVWAHLTHLIWINLLFLSVANHIGSFLCDSSGWFPRRSVSLPLWAVPVSAVHRLCWLFAWIVISSGLHWGSMSEIAHRIWNPAMHVMSCSRTWGLSVDHISRKRIEFRMMK